MKHYDREKFIWESNLPAYERLMLLALNSHIGGDGTSPCWPSHKTLADETGMSKSTVIRTLSKLQEKGLVLTSHRAKETNQQTSNSYKVSFERLTEFKRPNGGSRQTPPGVADRHPPSVRQTPPQCQSDTPGGSRVTHELSNRNYQKNYLLNDPPVDPFKAQAEASELRGKIWGKTKNDWNEDVLKTWASVWQKSGRNPGDGFINLKTFIRRNKNAGAEKHSQLMDEFLVVNARMESRIQTPTTTYVADWEDTTGNDPNFKPPSYEQIMTKAKRRAG